MIRGCKSRNRTLSTKPTEAEDRRVEEAASAEQRTAAEWLRGLAFERLRANGRDAGSVELFEVVGVGLLLFNVLGALGASQGLKVETFDRLLDEIGTAKHELAGRMTAESRR